MSFDTMAKRKKMAWQKTGDFDLLVYFFIDSLQTLLLQERSPNTQQFVIILISLQLKKIWLENWFLQFYIFWYFHFCQVDLFYYCILEKYQTSHALDKLAGNT